MISLGLQKLDTNQFGSTHTHPSVTLKQRKRIIVQFGVPSSTFHDWVTKYGLPTIKVKGRVFCTHKDLYEFIEKHRR